MGEYKPPFHMTDRITNLVAAISEQVKNELFLFYFLFLNVDSAFHVKVL